MRDHEEPEDGAEKAPEPGRQRRRLGQGQQHVARADDDEREEAEVELFGPAALLDHTHGQVAGGGTITEGTIVVVVVVVVVLVAAVARASIRPANAIASPRFANCF